MDYGIAYTDKQAKVLEKHIRSIYTEAKKDINGKLKEFNARFKVKDAKHKADLKAGLITKEDYQSWLKGQVFQGDHWKQMRAQMESILTNANEEAINIVNGGKISVIANNANYMAYTLEHGAGVNFGFALYDTSTVTNLLKEQPDLLPNKHVDPVKDGAWNRKKITRQVTLGILEGESTDQVADRLANVLSSQDQNAMLTTARTAMTSAQNAGRQLRMEEAVKKGIKLHKEWMCTLDLHTRTAHRELDGQKVPVDKPFKVDGYEIRFPADPQAEAYLVYNCRCTMVADLDDYPSVYQRYDNIDGVPVDQMTYKEWYKAKGFTDKKAKGIDYSEFGGKDVYDIFIKYKDMADWMLNAPTDEQLAIMSVSTDNVELKELFAKAHANEAKILAENSNIAKDVIDYSEFGGKKVYDALVNTTSYDEFLGSLDWDELDYFIKSSPSGEALEDTYKKWKLKAVGKEKETVANVKELTEVEKLTQKKLDAYDQLEKVINDNGIDAEKVYSNIWKDDVTLKDYAAKQGGIQGKKDYFEAQIAKAQASGNAAAEAKFTSLLADVEQFEKDGSKLAASYKDISDIEKDLKKAQQAEMMKGGSIFGDEAYTQARKDAAVWAKSSHEADYVLREKCGEVWRNATDGERDAIYEYTISYHKFNEPLRGIEYGTSKYKGVGNTDLNAGSVRNGKMLNDMTSIIDKSEYEHDQWFQRGCRFQGMDKFFNVDMNLLQNGTQEELENALLGKPVTEYGFMSMGSSKGSGFSGDILMNIYAPSGTKMMYVEPFSGYGNGYKRAWDGIKTQRYFGGELETILQQGTQFRVTKIERSGRYGTIYVDLEVINQLPPQLWRK